jgi:hypothetical protein
MQPPALPRVEPPEPVSDEELAAVLTAAIRDGKGGRMTREAEMFLAGVCADFLAERMVLAGLVVVRRVGVKSRPTVALTQC